MSADAPSVFVWISNRIQIWDGRHVVAVEIENTIYGGRNTEIYFITHVLSRFKLHQSLRIPVFLSCNMFIICA